MKKARFRINIPSAKAKSNELSKLYFLLSVLFLIFVNHLSTFLEITPKFLPQSDASKSFSFSQRFSFVQGTHLQKSLIRHAFQFPYTLFNNYSEVDFHR